jgi:hypothetical protein
VVPSPDSAHRNSSVTAAVLHWQNALPERSTVLIAASRKPCSLCQRPHSTELLHGFHFCLCASAAWQNLLGDVQRDHWFLQVMYRQAVVHVYLLSPQRCCMQAMLSHPTRAPRRRWAHTLSAPRPLEFRTDPLSSSATPRASAVRYLSPLFSPKPLQISLACPSTSISSLCNVPCPPPDSVQDSWGRQRLLTAGKPQLNPPS